MATTLLVLVITLGVILAVDDYPHETYSSRSLQGQCVDSSTKFDIGGELRGCIWVGTFKKLRCVDPTAQKMCPVTCDACPSISRKPTTTPSIKRTAAPTTCRDSLSKFPIAGELRGCMWVDAFKKERCVDPMAQKMCPVTCDTCPLVSKKPTITPSIKRTAAPTRKPTTVPSVIALVSPAPTAVPSYDPSIHASISPTNTPSTPTLVVPSSYPSVTTSSQPSPRASPTDVPVMVSSKLPASKPSYKPSIDPSSINPTTAPFTSPTGIPSLPPSLQKSHKPSTVPSYSSKSPLSRPTSYPSNSPTFRPSMKPVKLTARPSVAPTLSGSFYPTSLCRDSTYIFRWVNNRARSCSWVLRRKEYACTFQIARENCPQTCNVCVAPTASPTPLLTKAPSSKLSNKPSARERTERPSPPISATSVPTSQCRDSTSIFKWIDDKPRDCIWVSNHIEYSCKFQPAREFCPKSCGVCPSIITIPPTSKPSSPIDVPTAAPTLFSMSMSMSINLLNANAVENDFFF